MTFLIAMALMAGLWWAAGRVLAQEDPPPGPPLNLTATPSGWTNTQVFTLTWELAPEDGDVVGAWYRLDGPPATPDDGTFVSTTNVITGLGPVAHGQHVVYVWLQDAAGHADPTHVATTTLYVDIIPPGPPLDLAIDPTGWTNALTFTLSWTPPADDSGIAGAWVRLDTPPSASDDGQFFPGERRLEDLQIPHDGEHPVYVWLQDIAGNASYTQTATVTARVDRTPPLPPFDLISLPDGWTNRNSFTETWTNPDDLSGIVGAYYKLNAEPNAPDDGLPADAPDRATGIVVPGDGRHTIYIWLRDAAGNADHRKRNVEIDAFWYDGTPPVSQVTFQGTMGASGWYTTPVQARLAATDGDPASSSGVERVYHRLDAGAWQTSDEVTIAEDGVHILEVYARDVAGNVEPTRTFTIAIDTQPPSTMYTLTGVLAPSGWYTSVDTILDFHVSDATSGPAGVRYQMDDGPWQAGDHIVFTQDGRHIVRFRGQDVAGNLEPIRTLTVSVDAHPPTTAYTLEGERGDDDWFTSPITVSLVPTDTGSGVAATYYRIDAGAWLSGTRFTVAGDGERQIAFYSVDAAGNVEVSYPVDLRIDTQPPAPPLAVRVTPSQWSSTNAFTVTWATPTDLSGIAGLYYKIGEPPEGPTDGRFISNTFTIVGLEVPTEGEFPIYLWLRDGAGNVDHQRRATGGPLRFDATPPVTTLSLEGIPGLFGWYRGPVTVTLDPIDLHSGVAETLSQLDGGPWSLQRTYTITEPGKHLLVYRSVDVAGNEELTHTATIRIDPDPPAAPLAVSYAPRGWNTVNDFSLFWQSPLDLSGIAGAYVRYDAPPQFPGDGEFHTGTGAVHHLRVPGEGRHDVYVWLRDVAGNDDPATAVLLPQAFWFDGTPPSTEITIEGTRGENGWYVTPVTLRFTATDETSGVAAVYHQVNSGAWLTDTSLTLSQDGVYTVRVYAEDVAGNRESVQEITLRVDQHPPMARITGASAHVDTPDFVVSWSGWDVGQGSGLVSYDVQWREGLTGSWRDWRLATAQTSAVFHGARGKIYAFRVRARDAAGHVSEYSPPTWVSVDAVVNGDFDALFTGWNSGGVLERAVVPVDGPAGIRDEAVRLGTPDYERTVEPINPGCATPPGCVPVGAAVISQTIQVPPASSRPHLSLWYHIFTYDVMYSEYRKRYYDTFEVTIVAEDKEYLVLRDGNPTQNYGELVDLGWKFAVIDLSKFAGQTVTLRLSNHNRWDNLLNTWTFVDDVQVWGWAKRPRVYMPLVSGGGEPSSAKVERIPSPTRPEEGLR
ncbi:MAG TPA: fibronectin type III domain-containing protein [Caldilineae bacterium]|nr:fibronectin type III domain-containing protein [Caldilineae bacterium]